MHALRFKWLSLILFMLAILTGFRGEAALLQTARDWIEGGEYLVTFNGKSFDAPLMTTRYRLAGMRDPFTGIQHLDLFHLTRRAFGSRWPDCRLQTADQPTGWLKMDCCVIGNLIRCTTG